MATTATQPSSSSRNRAGAGMSRVLELDGLRAVAILLVLGCHYPGFANLAHKLPEFGWLGVDIFFALSGYLITTILLALRGRPAPYRTFYARRFIRILPPYLAVTLVLLSVALYQHWQVGNFLASQLLFLQAYPKEARDFAWALVAHPTLHLMHLTPLLTLAHNLPWGPVGTGAHFADAPSTYWSLSIEEYFYLLWAPIVLRCSRRTIVWIAVAVCAGEMLMRWMDASFLAYFSLLCRFDALLYGALLALLFEHWRRRGTPRWSIALFAVIATLASAALFAILCALRPIFGRELRASVLFLVVGLPLFSIAVSAFMGLLLIRAGGNWWIGRFLRMRLLLFIGTISYTMYLVQIVASTCVANLLIAAHWRCSALGQAIASSLLTVLIAYASWHYLEKPLLQWKDRRFPNAPHPPEPTLA